MAAIWAALGALAFMFGTFFLDHFRVGHLSFVNPMGWLPWASFLLFCGWTAPRRAWLFACGAGATIALAILEGGTTPIV